MGPGPRGPVRPRHARRAVLVLCCVLGVASGPGKAAATAMWTATSSGTLELVGFEDAMGNPVSKPAGLTILGTTTTSESPPNEAGNASASVAASAMLDAVNAFDLDVGDRFLLSGDSSGMSDVPPTSFALASGSGAGGLNLNNLTGAVFTVLFELTYSYSVSANASTALDGAQAVANIGAIAGLGGELVDLVFTDEGGMPLSETDVVQPFELTAPLGVETLTVFTLGTGIAITTPEPGSALLVGLGLAALSLRRRTR